MEENFKESLRETYEIIQNSESEIKQKIPKSFLEFIKNNMSNDYNKNEIIYNTNWKDSISDDTKAIIALIYRDYLISDEERNKLIQQEKQKRYIYEKELREKYNPDNIFKQRQNKTNDNTNNINLLEIKQTSWFRSILNKILKFFRKK